MRRHRVVALGFTKIAGEIYRCRNAGHYSVFAVTPAGVIETDRMYRLVQANRRGN